MYAYWRRVPVLVAGKRGLERDLNCPGKPLSGPALVLGGVSVNSYEFWRFVLWTCPGSGRRLERRPGVWI